MKGDRSRSSHSPILSCPSRNAAHLAATMDIHFIDPTRDERWEQFLQAHPDASLFHSSAWLKALYTTYGFQPLLLTTAGPSEPITNGTPFCRIHSWMTGSRLVSVPFSDHCQPLSDPQEAVGATSEFLSRLLEWEHCNHVELRPIGADVSWLRQTGFAQSATFIHHTLDLRPPLSVLLDRMHKSCFQRKIRRAERECLTYAEGSSDELLQQFYSLQIVTRRRHGVPPPPMTWFRNLRHFLGDTFKIGVASRNGRPIASIVTVRYKGTLVYKYGGSDIAFHQFGSMPFLFWETIQRAKTAGAAQLDLGRSDVCQAGLIAFKDHMGATATPIKYYRYPESAANRSRLGAFMQRPEISAVSARLPSILFRAASNILYRHMA